MLRCFHWLILDFIKSDTSIWYQSCFLLLSQFSVQVLKVKESHFVAIKLSLLGSESRVLIIYGNINKKNLNWTDVVIQGVS